MSAGNDEITILHWLQLAVDALVPLSVVLIGFMVKKYANDLEKQRNRNEIETQWRIKVFQTLSEELNVIYQFYLYQGDWKYISLDRLVESKRRCDKCIYQNKFVWTDEFLKSWSDFKENAFIENQGKGIGFSIRANVDRHRDNYYWEDSWADRFSNPNERIKRAQFEEYHDQVLNFAVRDLGLFSK